MSDFAGMTRKTCPSACTPECCIISTVAVCKHPFMVGPSGCGPVTIANQEAARKYVKHQEIDGGKHAEPIPGPARVRSHVVNRSRPKKAPRARKKAHAAKRGARVPARGQGQEDQPAGAPRQEEDVNA